MPDPKKKPAERKEVVREVVQRKEDEAKKEAVAEQKPEITEKKQAEKKLQEAVEQAPLGVSTKSTDQTQKPTKDKVYQKVESILEEDLEDMYHQLPLEKQSEFKAKGEETTGKIQEMVKSTHVKARKIVHWIKSWLKMIPGVNKFFLEQEAKIKTDKILDLAEEETSKLSDGLE